MRMGLPIWCFSLILLLRHVYFVDCTLTVVYIHGLLAGPTEAADFERFAAEYLPGSKIIAIDAFNHAMSLRNLTAQVFKIAAQVQLIMAANPDGIHLLCFSQGGVICRAIVQMLPDHTVHNFIALSSPMAGQYGVTDFLAPFLPCRERADVWKFLYTEHGQKLSIASYWNDPHHQAEFEDPSLRILLAILNNQTDAGQSSEFRQNFLRLKNLILIGGPDDGVITPWQSSQFGFYSDNETALPMEEQLWYVNDAFGLKTLNVRGAVHRYTISDVEHLQWHRNFTIFKCCILPWLQ